MYLAEETAGAEDPAEKVFRYPAAEDESSDVA
jgi:hypothetical protein